jgi:hypothetical protein
MPSDGGIDLIKVTATDQAQTSVSTVFTLTILISDPPSSTIFLPIILRQ